MGGVLDWIEQSLTPQSPHPTQYTL